MLRTLIKPILKIFPRPLLISWSLKLSPVLAWLYKGTAFTDPIDGKSFRCFLPYGYQNLRKNALSPSTLSLERHRLLWLYLKNETDFFTKNTKVLHLAPEQAFYKRFQKLKNLDYITCDLESPIADVKADICDLPFEDNSYDVIFCNHVLEHIPDDKKAMQELYRVLKPKGYAILQIPLDAQKAETYEDFSITDPSERAKYFGQYDHVRVYGMDYFDRLQNVGFDAKALHYVQSLPQKEVGRYGLDPNEILPICFK